MSDEGAKEEGKATRAEKGPRNVQLLPGALTSLFLLQIGKKLGPMLVSDCPNSYLRPRTP